MIDQILKDKIEDAFIHLEEMSGNKPQIGQAFTLHSNGVYKDSRQNIYDLVKSVDNNGEYILSYFLWIEIRKPAVQKYSEWGEWNTALNTAIIRIGANRDTVKVTQDGERQIIESVSKEFKVSGLKRIGEACRTFNSRNEWANKSKISIYPEYNPETGIDIYVRENPHKEYKRGEYFEKALKPEYYEHRTTRDFRGHQAEIIQKFEKNTSIESLFTVEKTYKEGEVYKENSYLCKSENGRYTQNLNDYIIAKLKLR